MIIQNIKITQIKANITTNKEIDIAIKGNKIFMKSNINQKHRFFKNKKKFIKNHK